MRIKASICFWMFFPVVAWGHEDHGSQRFHALTLETDIGASRSGALSSWDLDGWIGGNENKLWLKSEGGILDGEQTHQAEFWALYSRNIATFWDAQIGLRYDNKPLSATYLTIGFQGLAPYLFETEAHLFVSNQGDMSLRIHKENDFLITQKLITRPYAEINIFARDVPKQEVGAGIANGNIGIQTRYEITRKFAPYVDVRYEKKFGETSAMATKIGENRDDTVISAGLRFMF
jgi:copper resistance protein B